jgi:hypothetical protein
MRSRASMVKYSQIWPHGLFFTVKTDFKLSLRALAAPRYSARQRI